jgi:SCF-associated factor 1
MNEALINVLQISAHYQTFVAYSTGSSSIVLMGNQESGPESRPTVLPELQNKGVISVVLGDYHFGALTTTGKLYTWGKRTGTIFVLFISYPHFYFR